MASRKAEHRLRRRLKAIEKAWQSHYDLIISGYNFPMMTGIELAKIIRSPKCLNRETPLLLIAPELADKADVLSKRLNLDILLEAPVLLHHVSMFESKRLGPDPRLAPDKNMSRE